MNSMEIIMTRKSIRTFDGRKITDVDKEKLLEYIETIENPYNIPVEFLILDSEKYNLSSSVIQGEDTYIAAKVAKVEHCEEAYGYSFEKLILFAWSLGIGTTWIGGTLNRPLFEKAADTKDDEYMMIVTPIGYPSKTQSEVDVKLRESVRGDERIPSEELFFENNFSTPLSSDEDSLKAVRWAPSAANRQPWRIIKEKNNYHFYLEHTKGYSSGVDWDVQKIDLGIAICHFLCIKNGKFIIDEPEIETNGDREYIATVSCEE